MNGEIVFKGSEVVSFPSILIRSNRKESVVTRSHCRHEAGIVSYFLDYMEKLENINTSSLDSLLKESSDLEMQIEKERLQGGWLRQIDSMLTYLMLPAIKVYAETMVARHMSYRMAATAVTTQIYAKTHGHYPTALSELTLSDDQLLTVGDKPFGFRRIHEREVLLWGFNLRKLARTPDEPPPTDPPINSSGESAMDLAIAT